LLTCWATLICTFIDYLFALTLLGHSIIACCRMAGFAALRNTYRPFESRSIAEFWNRYYYYFKELLVSFFYYPAFVRYFKKQPWLRRNFAVFSAVFFGDTYYHFFSDLSAIQRNGFSRAMAMMDVYAVQCAILAIGISASQAWSRAHPGAAGRVTRGLALCRVVLFYCLMFSFVDESFTFPLGVHLRLFAILVGLPVT
jgi:D-alanyl-lipoteichoic acid acyltransferase DltB (MBOAT superfamily)